jgi:hypothetical protein
MPQNSDLVEREISRLTDAKILRDHHGHPKCPFPIGSLTHVLQHGAE